MKIHPTAIIDGDVQMEDGIEIGPYCVLQGKIRIGTGTRLESNVTLGSRYGILEVGKYNHFSPGAVIGGPPQDIGYKNEPTSLKIGDNNTFREFSTVSLATSKGDKETTIGNNNYFMAYVHLGHDCKVGNFVTMANNCGFGGHCVIEDNVTVSAFCAFNQWTRLGRGSFVAGSSIVNKDILPFSKAQGNYAVCRATNKIGLARKGFSPEEVENVHRAIRIILMGSDTIQDGLERIQRECQISDNITYFIDFIRNSKRGIAK